MIDNKKLNIAMGPVFDDFGGVSRYSFGVKKHSSHNVTIIPNKYYRKIFNASKYALNLYFWFQKDMDLSKFDAIHSNPNPWFIKRCISSRSSSCRWIHTYHTIYFKEDYPNGLLPFQEEINRAIIDDASQADVKISISHWLSEYLYKNHNIKTIVIPNGVDVELCEKANSSRFANRYKLSDFVLYVGYISPVKNPIQFIRLASLMPDKKFVMIGRNLSYEEFIQDYGIVPSNNIVFMGEMRHSDVLDAIAASKLLVMTSKHEGIPTVLLEAMSMGKPVVAPDIPGCKEIINNKKCGWLYEINSSDELYRMVNEALLFGQYNDNAKERILKTYDWKVVAKQIDKVYES